LFFGLNSWRADPPIDNFLVPFSRVPFLHCLSRVDLCATSSSFIGADAFPPTVHAQAHLPGDDSPIFASSALPNHLIPSPAAPQAAKAPRSLIGARLLFRPRALRVFSSGLKVDLRFCFC